MHDEGSSLAERALHADGAAVDLEDLLDDIEPEPEAAHFACGGRPLEALEDARLILRRDPVPVVADPELRAAAVGAQRDLHGTTAAVARGVRQQVRQDLLYPKAI